MASMIKKFLTLVMFEQTLFALPFAYLGVLFANGRTIETWFWVTLALVAARTAGMSFNRIIDADIDARNPRTKDRAIPAGELSVTQVLVVAVISCVIFVFSAYMLNRLCFQLSFVAVALLISYSYFKRFTAATHLYLGFIEAAAPIGGYLAVTGVFYTPGRFDAIPFLLGGAIMCWIAGLDIIYAMLDIDFDRREGLKSIPAKYGKEKAIVISRILYALAIVCLVVVGVLAKRKDAYWVSVACVAIVFVYQQKLARRPDRGAAIKELFQVNTFVSPALFVGTFIDVVIKY
ncbi:MAG: putative 4-hydroxybenzoate polyprenyltransferase [Spirochaetes bacterium]|nr:putative 4-hydroxybenzoate polyprenyltransferase [Spirochaetota bacterium]